MTQQELLTEAPGLLKAHDPETCDCGRPKVRECANCDKAICNHHGYRVQEGEPLSPILCGECKAESEVA